MKKLQKSIYWFLLLFVSGSSYSQDITGCWRGKYYYTDTDRDSTAVYMEIINDSANNSISGFTICMLGNFFGISSVTGYYNKKKDKFIITEKKDLEPNPALRATSGFDKYTISFKDSTNVVLEGIVQCAPNHNPYEPYNPNCSKKRKITLFKTNAEPPERLKRKPPERLHWKEVDDIGKGDTGINH